MVMRDAAAASYEKPSRLAQIQIGARAMRFNEALKAHNSHLRRDTPRHAQIGGTACFEMCENV
jgi:hypothetical protein